MLAGLRARFPSRLHSYPATDTEWLHFNTTLPPFDDVRVRRALNLAIDRGAVVRRWGGPDAAAPTCQLLPPGLPGHRPYCPYTRDPSARGEWTAPDLRRARRLVAASGTRGARVTVWGWSDDAVASPSVVRQAVMVLRGLGYRARARLVTRASLADAPERAYAGIHLFPTGWTDSSADGFFTPWLSCDGSGAHHWFCVPRLDRAMRRARRLASTRPLAADRLYARIDREIVDRAALVPLVNPRQTDFVSARVRNLQHHAYLGPIVDQLVVR
jgi:ABC-type transport system substrate-binding protein